LPIPPADDNAGVVPTRAVTLSEARLNDALFRQFDVPDGPAYPWSAAAVGDANVRFVIDAAYASPRMLALQSALPAGYAATLFDGPSPGADSPSLQDRVVAAGKDGLWSAESVSAWKYPEQQLAAFFTAGAENSPDARNLLATQYGPRIVRMRIIDGVETDVEEDSPQPLRVVRVMHLRGNVPAALEAYGDIRKQGQLRTVDNSAVLNDAIHWVTVCQEDLQLYDAAVSNLKLSLRNYPNGIWSAPSKSALARCEALRGNLPQAIELLPAPEPDQPPKPADAYLMRRWQAMSAPAASPSNESR